MLQEEVNGMLLGATRFRRFDGEAKIAYDYALSERTKKDYWKVTESFSYYTGNKEDQSWIIIPEGYQTDGSSTPRLFWSIVPPWGKYGPAVIIHDWLCDGRPIYRNGTPYYPGRKEIDGILKEAMKVLEVPKWKRIVMYAGVRLYAYVTLDFS